ncbi:hypothetical protein ACP_2604 [Acidobacterium capsulatum ATCC 51196]|uniref:Uncharacterized protein n=1 Tax=Acidobacterium capsulatum (strain ATCC 51196 / DSM 11244 / BCRC 80197 / JCM 7670 / NBRC 15755 / NCIMB 13165 / 161) TaxID=240015 RepID=C1F2E6_ACIC5|nr:hypothetical protein ACP_2604 [Acidobacterium capsulatum ATCC 51196]
MDTPRIPAPLQSSASPKDETRAVRVPNQPLPVHVCICEDEPGKRFYDPRIQITSIQGLKRALVRECGEAFRADTQSRGLAALQAASSIRHRSTAWALSDRERQCGCRASKTFNA